MGPYYLTPRQVVAIFKGSDIIEIWQNITATGSSSQKYWSKIIALWWLLDGKHNVIRLVEGMDSHCWIEMDFPIDSFIFDWNIIWYGNVKGNPASIADICNECSKIGDVLGIISRYKRNNDLVNDNLYGIKDYDIVNRCMEDKWVYAKTGWDNVKINRIKHQCFLLHKEYKAWRTITTIGKPNI